MFNRKENSQQIPKQAAQQPVRPESSDMALVNQNRSFRSALSPSVYDESDEVGPSSF